MIVCTFYISVGTKLQIQIQKVLFLVGYINNNKHKLRNITWDVLVYDGNICNKNVDI